jgi:hypothetical protein
MLKWRPGPFLPVSLQRIIRLHKWVREYLHHVDTFVGSGEVRRSAFRIKTAASSIRSLS